ncbi:hypothetical protein HPP92_020738 [Vanilla planifolia]|uniref:Uncharacterized protein n=1 Tax=Vanilla planifolia TaxID=51239 RepID=A0A835PXU6_VANPL|nr:hypothetical protein HPP92_020738 [Vanilla planifolia]
MLFRSDGGGALAAAGSIVRYFSKKRSVDVRRINPKVPRENAKAISDSIYGLIKQRGHLSVSNTWDLVKDMGINGLNSKTHMKIMLKWMRGRKMLKLFCTHHGSMKRFFHCTLPEEPKPAPSEQDSFIAPSSETSKPSPEKKNKKVKKEFKRLLESVQN